MAHPVNLSGPPAIAASTPIRSLQEEAPDHVVDHFIKFFTT
jgi:hypothetical protein